MTTTLVETTWAHELIAYRAAQSSANLAVCDCKGSLTFAELDARANRLARYLQTLGVGIETPVGLLFERSTDFVVAALAVLKAGGAYVPLDPAYPPTRIHAILKDAGVPVLLSHKWMPASLPGGTWKVVDLDFDVRRIDAFSADSLDIEMNGDNLAYIIYTSGSSGAPKGVEITHANLLHLIEWHGRAFSVTSADRASQFAGLAFDAAVWEIWCHLAAGASLHLIDEESRRTPEAFQAWLVNERITIAFAPTIFAEHLITLAWPKETSLRILLTGADTLHRYPNANLPFALANNYGPTECTVLVTSGTVTSGAQKHIPSIGRPIDNTEILISEEGEICIAGPQVGRGYRNLPELTAEKFTQDTKTGRRVYKTGDRGKVLADGQVAFLGRLDDQIKIRGFRIEPDEVVAQLKSHAHVRNSVVIAHGEDADEKALVAYMVLAPGAELTATQLREFLQPRLPEYMIPSVYVAQPSLPLTTSGKCDKRALPAPTSSNVLPDSCGAPKNGAGDGSEVQIAKLVTGLINGKPIGRDDNFFMAGGHSMMAAQLIARVRDTLSVSLSLRQLFEAPTIASLAEVIDRKLAVK